jgi:hypothetical protein
MVAAAVDAAGAFLGNDRTSLMLMDHDLRELHRSASLRADGSSTRGRKTKHDTATRRWIDTVGFPMLAQGRLPDAHDIAMLRSGPRHLLSGTALAARDAWSSQLHQGDNARWDGRGRCVRSREDTPEGDLGFTYKFAGMFSWQGGSAIAAITLLCNWDSLGLTALAAADAAADATAAVPWRR